METQQRKIRLLQLAISTVAGLTMVLGVVSALTAGASPLLAMETEDGAQRATGHAGDAPAPLSAASCWATIDGTTVYSSTDASALQDAVDAATSGDTVKVAGTCAGVQSTGGHTQTLYIATSGITVQGGYTYTSWLADPDPDTYPTVLDAQNAGRVVLMPPSTKVSDVTLDGLYITNGNTVDAAAGSCWHSHPDDGGGLCLSNVSNITVRNSIIYGNTAKRGGGLHHQTGGDVLVVDTSVISNVASIGGGGISQIYEGIELQDCTISGNTSDGNGGGIYVFSERLTVVNTTISGNTGPNGGGVYLDDSTASAAFINSMIVSNTATFNGGGLYRRHAATTITNTIVAYNSDVDNSSPDCYGEITSGDYNLIQDTTGCTLTGTLTHVITNTDPLLEPLADNGGETETHALPQSSPAVDWIPVGTNGCGTTITEDQRGVMRPQADGCDIGSYEVEAPCQAEITGDDIADFTSWDASAVEAAIAALDPTSDTVKLAGTCAGVQLHEGTVQTVYVDRNVTLQGGYTNTNWLADPNPDAYPTTLDAEYGGHVVYVPGGYTVAIEGLTLTRGEENDGGGVYNAGSDLTLDTVQVLNSSASVDGGGIYNAKSGNITIAASTIASNTCGDFGGGVLNWGTLIVTDSLFQGNQSEEGGGLFNYGTLDLVTSTFVSNVATGWGGGIYNLDRATFTQSAITGNQSQTGGGIVNDGDLSLVDCTVAENNTTFGAGGIYNAENASITLTGSTIAGNQAGTSGGGIVNWGEQLSLINSTVSGNTAQARGGGLYQNDPGNYVPAIHLLHTTIVSNSAASGGDGFYLTVGKATFTGTVVAYNETENCAGSGVYTYTSGGYNLEDADTCGFAATGDVTGTNPLLDPLADNGGPTETHLPLSGSPVLDAIPEGSCAVSTDQRDEPRPSDGACDVGAVELWVNDPPVTVDDVYTTDEDVPLVITATLGMLANDSDPEGASLAAYLLDEPANGTVALARDGGFVYTPTQDFNGSDSFRYLASDGGPEAAAYWPFEAGSGTTASDETGNGNDGTLTGGPTFTTTVPATPTFTNSTALHFDGVDDVVAIPNSDDINLGTHERRTVTAWFNVDDETIDSRKQVIWEEGGSANGLNIYIYDGGLYAGAWNDSSGWDGVWLGPVDVGAGYWHHVALVLDGSTTPGTLELYLDGELAAGGDGYALDEHANAIGIGQAQGDTQFHDGNVTGGGHAFGGLIDDVRVYNQAFAADWIVEAMEETTPGLDSAATVTITVSAVADAPRAAADVYTTTVNTSLVVDQTPVTVTATSSPALTIPDDTYDGSLATMACDTLDTSTLIESNWVVQELSVTLSITHSWVGDLVIKLVSPEGSVLGLVSRPGNTELVDDGGDNDAWGTGADLYGAFPIQIYDGAPYDAEEMGAGLGWSGVICRDNGECDFYPNPGAVAGLSDMAGFSGERAAGDWQLCVGDSLEDVEGTLASWSLELVAMEPGVLFNDVEPDGDSLTAALLAAPTNGDVSLASDGTFVYTPSADFIGADAFTYVASDGVLTDTAVVTVTVPDPGPLSGACFAEIHGGSVTDFASWDAVAVQAAVDAVADGGTVKLAGTCAGVEARAGLTQTVFISRDVTLQGGYTTTNWLADPDPTAYTTTLDADGLGRVAYVSGTLDVTLDGLSVTGGDGAQSGGSRSYAGDQHGGGIYVESGSALTIANSVVYSNTITVMDDGGALMLDGTASAVITNTTFADNVVSNGKGGAIYVWEGALDVYTSHFADNTASISGGAIYLLHNTSPLRITDSSFEGNAGRSGGGVCLNDGAAEVYGSLFTGNHTTNNSGGAINVSGGALLVEDSTFEGNWSPAWGGAIYVINSGDPVTLTNTVFRENWVPSSGVAGALSLSAPTTVISSTFEGNSSGRGGAIRSGSDLTITRSLFRENAVAGSSGIGGAIYHFTDTDLSIEDSTFISNTALHKGGALYQDSGSMLTLTSSTFVSNSASYGGALYLHPASSYATLQNVTLSANTAITSGGGIHNDSLLALNHVTLAGNTVISPSGGGGLYNGGALNISHTLIAGSGAGKDCVNDHILGVNEYNLVEDGTCSPHLSGAPLLTPLADNGGATLTHLPYGVSPVVDAIPAAECTLATDQRDEPRPANGGCDIGAVEFDYGVPGVELGLDSVIEAVPGDRVTHTFVMTHTGDVVDIFDLALSGHTWPTTLSTTETGLLEPGEPFPISVVVTVPEDPRAVRAIIGSDVFTLTATSQVDGTTSATATGTTQATAAPGVALDGDQSGSGRVGEPVTYTVGVTNNGTFTDTVDLTTRGNTWPVTLSAAPLVLGAGDVDTVVITVTIPTTATLGSGDTVTLTATSQLDSLVGDSATFATTMETFEIYLPFVTKE